MAHAMRAMQAAAITGNKAAALPGSLPTLEFIALKTSKIVGRSSSRPSLSIRASQSEKEDHRDAVPALVTPVTIASTLLANAGAAQALTAEDVTAAFLKVQSASSQVTQTAGNALSVVKDVLQQAFTAVKPAVDAATPYVQQTADAAFKAVVPVATDLEQQAEKALQNAGVDTKPVLDAAKTAVSVAGEAAGEAGKYLEGAQPYAFSTLEQFLASDPLILAGGAGALLLVYFLAPPLFSSIAYAARGYQGDLTAPQALDLLSKEDYTLIDVRTDKEKAKSGVPSLPKNAKNKFLPVPVEELPGKLKGQLRNARKVEAEVAALKISSLKKLNRGSKIVIIDSTGDIAKIVARSLSGLGFNNTRVVVDGYMATCSTTAAASSSSLLPRSSCSRTRPASFRCSLPQFHALASPLNSPFVSRPRRVVERLERRTLHITNAKNVSSERKGVTVSPPEPEISPEELVEYERLKSQLEGITTDFWEGPQWNALGFIMQYLWVFGIVVSIVACLVAVRTYNLGATDFKNTAVFKEALEQQTGDLGDDSSEPSVFEDSSKEAP